MLGMACRAGACPRPGGHDGLNAGESRPLYVRSAIMAIKTYGLMSVDWEERVNVERLRSERLARIKKLLKESELGALLCFDMGNIRYITATHIGTWAMDKLARFTLR